MGRRKLTRVWILALLQIVFVASCGWREQPPSPALQSISPNRASPGQAIVVTIEGRGFVYGSTINVGGAMVTVRNVETVTSTQIIATFAIAPNAPPGPVSVSVSTYGVTTNAVTFTIGLPPKTPADARVVLKPETHDRGVANCNWVLATHDNDSLIEVCTKMCTNS